MPEERLRGKEVDLAELLADPTPLPDAVAFCRAASVNSSRPAATARLAATSPRKCFRSTKRTTHNGLLAKELPNDRLGRKCRWAGLSMKR